jgi:hypothetical protein
MRNGFVPTRRALHIDLGPNNLEELAAKPPPDIAISPDEADAIACLALSIAHRQSTIADPRYVPYLERDPRQRATMRNSVIRVVQAMALLGYFVET